MNSLANWTRQSTAVKESGQIEFGPTFYPALNLGLRHGEFLHWGNSARQAESIDRVYLRSVSLGNSEERNLFNLLSPSAVWLKQKLPLNVRRSRWALRVLLAFVKRKSYWTAASTKQSNGLLQGKEAWVGEPPLKAETNSVISVHYVAAGFVAVLF